MHRLRLPVLGLLLAVGCGPTLPKLYPVRGGVTLPGGGPATAGTVALVSRSGAGPTYEAAIRRDGRFEVMAEAGDYAVTVSPKSPYDSGDDPTMLKEMPKLYLDPKTTPLGVTVPAAADLQLGLKAAPRGGGP